MKSLQEKLKAKSNLLGQKPGLAPIAISSKTSTNGHKLEGSDAPPGRAPLGSTLFVRPQVRRAKSIRSGISMGGALANVNKQLGVEEGDEEEGRKPTTLRRGMSRGDLSRSVSMRLQAAESAAAANTTDKAIPPPPPPPMPEKLSDPIPPPPPAQAAEGKAPAGTSVDSVAAKAPADSKEEEKKEEKKEVPEVVAEPAPDGSMEVKVTTKKSANFYIRAVQSFLKGVDAKPAEGEKEAVEAKPPVELLRISGLGEAVNVAITAATQAEHEGLCTITKIQTLYPPMESTGRGCAQVVIDLKKK
jgi:hypothetical protein